MSPGLKIASWLTGKWTKWIVLAVWLVIFAVSGPLAGKLTGVQENDLKNWLPGSAESTKALELQESFQSSNVNLAVIVYERPSGVTDADKAKAAADAQRFSSVESFSGQVTGPIPSDDGKALETIVPIDLGANGWDKAPGIRDQILDIAAKDTGGVDVHLTGPLGIAADSAEAFEGIDGVLLISAAVVVIVLLLLTYRSPTLWLLPVIGAFAALMASQAVVYLLAKYAGLTVNAQSAGILTVLVFGAGTDYALLLVARYREELRRHEDRHEAMAVAMHRAGPAIVASAATVVVGMLCLLFASMNSTMSLGPVAAVGIGVALLAMTTLLPALLVIFGRWFFWPRKPTYGSADPTVRGIWARMGNGIAKRPRAVWVVTALVLGVMALGMFDLKSTGLSFEESFTNKPKSIVGAEVLARHYPAGSGQPVVVVGNASAAQQLRDALARTQGISQVSEPAIKDGYVSIEGTLADAPDSGAANDTVDRVRDAVHAVPGADAKVGGQTAMNLDAQRAARRDGIVIIPIVLVVVFLILALLLRAVIAPLLLVATVVLSFAAALGVSALVFDFAFGFAAQDSTFPLFVFVFLVALGIDYNIFLMTRVREETQRHGTRRGMLIGLAATGGVITSAGIVLAGTFAALATLPMVFLAELGFAVAFGVLLDTIVVRSILVPGLVLDSGKRIWWPSRLAKDRDVEREALSDDKAPATVG